MLPFWKNLKWQPGCNNCIVEVDAGKTIGETNEGNNIAGTVLKK